MPQQQPDVSVTELEHLFRKLFLMRSLIKYSKTFEPSTDSSGLPSVSVVRDHQLVPISPSDMSRNSASHGYGTLRHDLTICL
jgi:hypothetical protein